MPNYSERILSLITANNDAIHKIIDKYAYGVQYGKQSYCDEANSMLHRLFVKMGYKTDNDDTQAIIDFINEKITEKTEPF